MFQVIIWDPYDLWHLSLPLINNFTESEAANFHMHAASMLSDGFPFSQINYMSSYRLLQVNTQQNKT